MNEGKRASLDALLDGHGATPERWPAAHREAALELLRDDPTARARWHSALDLEAALDDWTVPEPAADLALRIAAAAPARGSVGDVLALRGLRLWQGAVLAAIPVLIGFVIAVVQVEPPASVAGSPWSESAAATEAAAEIELGWLSAYGLLAPETGRAP